MNEQPTNTSGRRFHLLEIVGEGAYGEVYLAEQDSGAGFKRKVAIKLLHANVAKSKEAGRRMRDEARILGMLSHRNIVTVLDLVLLDDRWAVIMDYVPGVDLEQCADALKHLGERFPAPAALEVGASVCAALHSAYHATDRGGNQLRVVHRDIKPSNVRLTLDGDVKVLDFGVASVQLDAREASTRGSAWLGTERYMAPERILCESDDAPGDVYAAAATIVELLLGRPLGRTPVLDERHTPFIADAADAVRERIPGPLGGDVATLLEAALAANPDDRPAAATLGAELRSLSRRLQGEDLVEFSNRFVSQVPAHLGIVNKPATGVLSESISDVRGPPPDPRTSSNATEQAAPTLLPSDGGFGSEESDETLFVDSGSPPRRRRFVWLVAAMALVSFGGLSIGTLLAFTALGLQTDVPEHPPSIVVDQPDPAPIAPVVPSPPAPEPEPVAEPEPVDAPEPVAAPDPVVAPAPRPVPSPVEPVPVAPPEPEAAEVDPDAVRIPSALVAVRDGTGLQVVCGDRTVSGTASARLRDFPAGMCTVSATYLGTGYSTTVSITGRREVRCAVEGEALRCN